MNRGELLERLIVHEGMRLKPYLDTQGKLSVGVGRNLDDVGISKEEARTLALDDIMTAEALLDGALPWWRSMNEARQQVLCEMCFNMGWGKLREFVKALQAMQDTRWDDAAAELLDSKWARQVGARAVTLAQAMRTGAF